MFQTFRTRTYKERFLKLGKAEQCRVADIEQQVRIAPHTGKPLGYEFFREKKFDGKRVLFLIYDDLNAVLFVTITDKKDQEESILRIKGYLNEFKEEVRELLRRG